MSWISAANATGVGIGYTAAGAIIQRAGTADAFLAAAVLVVIATITVLARQGSLEAGAAKLTGNVSRLWPRSRRSGRFWRPRTRPRRSTPASRDHA
jgi:hypothetical protein